MSFIHKAIHISAAIAFTCVGPAIAAGPDSYTEVSEPVPAVTQAAPKQLPVYLSELSNLNDYVLFANAGWDGNWYAGFNVCWMEELPPAPAGSYSRAYIGVKLGRMKQRPVKGKPAWEKEPIPGVIYAAISSTSSWRQTDGRAVADSRDIPLEGEPENAIEGVGEARWFWAEIPVASVNTAGSNFVAVWSPTEYYTSVASSPVLAGGWGGQKVNSWMNNDVRGYPPLDPSKALKTPITVFEPAIALKLVPAGSEREVRVGIAEILDGRAKTANKTFIADVSGDNIERVWLEISSDGKTWARHERCIYSAPWQLTLKAASLPDGSILVRCAAEDVWGTIGYSQPAEIKVTR